MHSFGKWCWCGIQACCSITLRPTADASRGNNYRLWLRDKQHLATEIHGVNVLSFHCHCSYVDNMSACIICIFE